VSGDDQIVGIDLVRGPGDTFKQSGFMNAFQLEFRPVLFVNRLDLDPGGIGQKGPNNQSGTITEWMHAEQGVRRLMDQLNQALQLCGRENHAGQPNTGFSDWKCSSAALDHKLQLVCPSPPEGKTGTWLRKGGRWHGSNLIDHLKDLFTRPPAARITRIKEFTPAAWPRSKAKEQLVAPAA
jgi:hypothetical protein